MMPFWMKLLGYRFLKNNDSIIHVPYDKIIVSLLTLIIPLLIGIAISRFNQKLAEKAKKVFLFN